ncbi:CASP-like protein 3A1 [Camellia lanceoleosa]|uniref:CASP-like protein 3A1 n=1 Tax=Camellia lanceoleosa TaxID=1840588 RepID=A0ACC0I1L9_9ERIC|nr:CASP-like protein 3A1 [Camellia lanceoleosa]
MMNGKKTLAEAAIQLPETKVAAAAEESGTNSGPLKSARRKLELTHIVLRLACLSTAVASLSLMATAEEASTVSIYGFSLPVYSKWSFADSFVYLVGVSAAAAAHSVVQFLISTSRLLHKSPVIPSRSHAWIIFAGDQAFAYAMMSAGSAASGVTNLNRTGIKHSALPNFCKPLHSFCDRVAVSIAFTFVSCAMLTASIVVDVIWLSKC